MRGKIKNINDKQGFGFIRGDDGNEYFFHRSGCLDPFEQLEVGDKVDFEDTTAKKGLRAENVEKIND